MLLPGQKQSRLLRLVPPGSPLRVVQQTFPASRGLGRDRKPYAWWWGFDPPPQPPPWRWAGGGGLIPVPVFPGAPVFGSKGLFSLRGATGGGVLTIRLPTRLFSTALGWGMGADPPPTPHHTTDRKKPPAQQPRPHLHPFNRHLVVSLVVRNTARLRRVADALPPPTLQQPLPGTPWSPAQGRAGFSQQFSLPPFAAQTSFEHQKGKNIQQA